MTYQEVKQTLKDYLFQRENVKKLKAILDRAQGDRPETLQTVDYTRLRVQGGKTESPVERAVIRREAAIEMHRRRYESACEKMLAMEDAIAGMLQALTSEEQNLIIERYLQGVELREVARKHFYTPESLVNKYTKIYKKLANKVVV